MKISRNEEANLPDFSSHEMARKYFKNKYGDRFVMTNSEILDGMKIYFYSLILDNEIFEDGQKKIGKGDPVHGLDFMNSYQPIEIWEDGRIHIIH